MSFKKVFGCFLVVVCLMILFPVSVSAAGAQPPAAEYHPIFLDDNRVEVDYGRYGWTRNEGTTFHTGIDIDTFGDPTVHATIGGVVKYARMFTYEESAWDGTWEWGYFVWIIGDDGYNHIYAHNAEDSLMVSEGDYVQTGQPLAIMGMTGNAMLDPQAEHVHYEVRDGYGTPVDPSPFAGIPNEVGSTMKRSIRMEALEFLLDTPDEAAPVSDGNSESVTPVASSIAVSSGTDIIAIIPILAAAANSAY